MSGQSVRKLRWRLALAGWVADVVGAAVVFVFLGTFHAVEGVRGSDAMGAALFHRVPGVRAPRGMSHWFLGEENVLRGQPAATRVATPTANGSREEVSRC